MGPSLAVSMQENPPAAAASAKLADIFKASRRLMLDMDFSCRLAGNRDTGSGQTDNFPEYKTDFQSCQRRLPIARRVGTRFAEAATLR
jgi:hypothetical protein